MVQVKTFPACERVERVRGLVGRVGKKLDRLERLVRAEAVLNAGVAFYSGLAGLLAASVSQGQKPVAKGIRPQADRQAPLTWVAEARQDAADILCDLDEMVR